MRIARESGEEVEKAVEAGLSAFNAKTAGSSEPIQVNIAVRDDSGAIKGGIVARVWLDGLYISLVWLDDALRGAGHGKAMMALAEAEGRKHGATLSWLNTLSWQARPFYEALGYRCIGEMPVASGKHKRYFMLKTF